LTTTDDVVTASRCLDEDGHGVLRTTTREIHRESIDSSTFETDDVWLHRRCIARSTVAEDDSHRAYRRSLRDVSDGRVMSRRRRVDGRLMLIINAISSEISTTTRKKILREGLTRVGFIEYHNNLYGDAARGCHHRGNGPDARMRTIFVSRQRLGVLIKEGPRRNPWGYRGGACRSDPVHVTSQD